MQYSKDGITVAVILDKFKPKKNGLFPVRIRVTYRRQRRYYPTGKDLTPDQWESMPTTRNRELRSIRESVSNTFEIVRQHVEELAYVSGFSFEALDGRLRSGLSATINTAFRAKIDDLRTNARVGSMLVYDNVLKGIERFKGDKIPFESITVDWLKRYERFLTREGKTTTTIGIHFRTIRAIVNEARRAGIVKEAQYPFGKGRFEIQAGEGRKMALTLEQIGRIVRYEDGSQATAKYRDYWLFLYLCNGINMADFVKLRYRDIVNGEICFVRQKTERTTKTRKEIRVVISEPMQAIINRWGNERQPDKFIFPVLVGTETALEQKRKTQYLTRSINRRMAAIGKALGIDHISTYTAKHHTISI